MVDKAAIFTDLTRRNALRREAKLPLLDVQAEFVHAVEVATWREACKEHADDIARIREQAEADFRQRHCADGGLSAGGRWAINYEIIRRIIDLMAAHGVHRPTPHHAIIYGSNRSEVPEET